MISENLITNSSKEFLAPRILPVKVWRSNNHLWVKHIDVANHGINVYIQNIRPSGLFFKHESQNISLDKYEDLPFLSRAVLKGKYIYTSLEIWVQEIKLEAIKSPKRKLWPTPLATDWHFYRMNKPRKESSWGGVETRNLNNCLAVCVHWEAQKYKTHQVNPRWVEQMMGLPIGWSDSEL